MIGLLFLLLHLTTTHQQECRNPVDVIFALDATVDFYQFEQMKHFLNDSLNEFYVDEKITRVAVLSYATRVVASRNLSAFQTKEAISQFVNGLNIEDDKPNIASAFAAVRNNVSKISERRDMVPVVVVLLSGGGVDNFDAALVESISLRETHVSIIIATMNNSIPFTGFYVLASYPFKRNFYTLNSNDVQSDLIANICNRDISTCRDYCQGRGECISDSCDCFPGFSGKFCNNIGCFQPVNIYFALTAASSIDAETFVNQLDLVQSVLLNLNLMESKIGMAVYYNNTFDVKFDFKNYENFSTDGNWFQRRMLDATSSVFRMGYTNLTHVLKVVRQSVFASGENNVLVLFVSGPSADILASAREAALARNGPEVIQILVVTVGDLFSRDEVDAIAITPGVNMNQGVNILPFNSFRPNLATDLVNSICNTKYECFPNPCLNSGICIDFINGYRCYCPNNRAGLNCEYVGNEYIDLVFGFDTSGSIRNREFEDLLSFAVRLVSKLDVSPSKTRVAGVKWNRIGYDLFHLDTFTSKQDVGWAISQITYEPFEEGTNTTDALRIIKDILLNPGQNGERQSARNIVLLFTDGNSNVGEDQTIPMAIELKTTRNTRIITFGFGHFINYNEMTSTCLIPPKQNEDYFIIPSVDFINNTFDALFQTIISVGSCQNETCRNGGFCELRRRPVCTCSGPFGGKYCEKYCSQSIDLVFLLDTSGSEAYTTVNRNIALARQIASFLPLESTKFSVVTFGSSTRINFSLKNFNNFQDLVDTFAFRVSTGSNFIRNAIKFLGEGLTAEGPQIFSTTNGGRRSSADVVVIISGSYSTFEYEEVIKEAQIIRNTGTSIYTVLTGNSPNKDLYLTVVGNPSRFFTLNSTEELDRVVERITTTMCSDNNI